MITTERLEELRKKCVLESLNLLLDNLIKESKADDECDPTQEDEHSKKILETLLNAVCFYRDCSSDIGTEEYLVCNEQEGALRANLYGEEEGWRTVEQEAEYHERKGREQMKRLQEILEATKE